MKVRIHFLALFALLFTIAFFGCQQQKTSQETNAIVQQAATTERVQIPLDENMPGAKADVTRNFYFVFDGSGSMTDNCGEGDKQFDSKIQGAKWAVHEFMNKVPTDVNLGLFVFDNNSESERVPLGPNNRDAFLTAVDHIDANAGTPLAEAMMVGVDKLVEQYKKQLGYGEYRLVVVTDGEATGRSIVDAAVYATKFGIPIYTIGFCMGGDHALRQYSVSYRAAGSSADLAHGLEQTLGESDQFDPVEFSSVDTNTTKR